MRVALITFCPPADGRINSIVKTLESGSVSRGNQVELINGYQDLTNTRLTAFDYIAVVFKAEGLFGGKLPARIGRFLATSGSIVSKKGCALVIKAGFSSAKACKNLMKVMEAEGVKLDYFDIVGDEEQARITGKKIG